MGGEISVFPFQAANCLFLLLISSFSHQVLITVRRSTRPTVSSATGVEELLVLVPTSMQTRPNVTTKWRRSSTAFEPLVSFWGSKLKKYMFVWLLLKWIYKRSNYYLDRANKLGVIQHWVTWNLLLISGGASADGFSAIKMTALGRPQFLVSLTSCLQY